MVSTFMCVPRPAAIVFDNQVHLLDALIPNDRFVLPKRLHRNVLFIHTRFTIGVGSDATVTVLLSFIGDVANAPGRRFVTFRLLQDFEPDVDGAIAIVDRARPIFGTVLID